MPTTYFGLIVGETDATVPTYTILLRNAGGEGIMSLVDATGAAASSVVVLDTDHNIVMLALTGATQARYDAAALEYVRRRGLVSRSGGAGGESVPADRSANIAVLSQTVLPAGTWTPT